MRFMHIADIHLGAAPDQGYLWAKDRGREIWDSFRRCIQDANEKRIDLLLVAGDLFHSQPQINELREVNRLFSTLERTMVVLIAGNHDYIRPGSPYLTFQWNKNVICLFGTSCERVRIPQLNTEIYGFSYHQAEIHTPEYDRLHAEKNGYFSILLAHGGDASHIPVSKEALARSGFDYIALGHIHKPQVLIKNHAIFSGALEPVDHNDPGTHGYVLGEANGKNVRTTFVPFASREYKTCNVALTQEDTAYTIREKISTAIQENGTQNIYKICLTGSKRPQMRLDLRDLTKCGRIIEVKDMTVPDLPINQLRSQYRGDLIGDFIESFGAAPASEVEEKALKYGLQALLYQV